MKYLTSIVCLLGVFLPTSCNYLSQEVVNKAVSETQPHKGVKVSSLVSSRYLIHQSVLLAPEQLDKHFKGVLKGHGKTVVAEAQKNGVCPVFLAAVLIHESGNGTSRFAREINNVAGIYDNRAKKYRSFTSVSHCIAYTARIFGNKNYLSRSVKGVQERYCPYSPKEWVSGVVSIMKSIGKDATVIS